ncbi:uncharacterized protein [Haliotis cracherodii]|uniref:uncharacterized protein n=1 Tax=Haliotis cracherodii TaxID=6455 RepID=UPI0039EB17F3
MLEKGYAEHIPDDEPEPDDGLVWYIPHHGVYHPKKMKLRVVFNCAATYNDGDYGNPPLKYRMKVHMFGTTSSPSCANAALLKTASDNEEMYESEIAEIVRNNFYVDDCLFSEQDVTKTVSCVTQQWIADLPLLEKVSIPRCYKPSDFGTVRACQLHIFSDASNEGYGLTAYLWLKNEMGKVHCSLVMAKARVMPIKKVTTPRLKLTAACVAVRLSRILQKELQYKLTDIFYWTDSMSVIGYVNNETSRFKTFVANRITIIRDGSDPRQWKHIPTALNPADAASRGMRMATFLKMDQWFKGPTFLWESEEEWPSVVKACDNFPEDDPEMKPVVAATVTDESVDIMYRLLNYSSSWLKLKKIIGWFLLFMDYLKRKLKEKQESAKRTQECAEHLAKSKKTKVTVQEEKSRGHLTVKILEKAEVTILCYIQQQYFHDVISALKNPSKESRLNKSIRKLDPFLVD